MVSPDRADRPVEKVYYSSTHRCPMTSNISPRRARQHSVFDSSSQYNTVPCAGGSLTGLLRFPFKSVVKRNFLMELSHSNAVTFDGREVKVSLDNSVNNIWGQYVYSSTKTVWEYPGSVCSSEPYTHVFFYLIYISAIRISESLNYYFVDPGKHVSQQRLLFCRCTRARYPR